MNYQIIFSQFMARAMPHVQENSNYWDTIKSRFSYGILCTLDHLDMINRTHLLDLLKEHYLMKG